LERERLKRATSAEVTRCFQLLSRRWSPVGRITSWVELRWLGVELHCLGSARSPIGWNFTGGVRELIAGLSRLTGHPESSSEFLSACLLVTAARWGVPTHSDVNGLSRLGQLVGEQNLSATGG
jgi:hypothetical protein